MQNIFKGTPLVSLLLLWLAVSHSNSLLSKEKQPEKNNHKYQVAQIDIQVNPIFDLEENDSWFYSTANGLHIDTKPYVIERILPIKVGDRINKKDLAEAERVLRSHRYLREAKIMMQTLEDQTAILKVKTWESWTLFPTIDLKRQGGENEYGYGIKDDNLLGLGLAANIAYFAEEDRSGHIIRLSSDAISNRHLRASLSFADNSDGREFGVSLDRPFYKLADRHSVGASVNNSRKEISIDANETLVNRFESDSRFADVYFGYSTGKTEKGIFRWIGGIRHIENTFSTRPLTLALPENRKLTYPWLAFEYQQDRFKTTKNLYLLERTEDVRLGWYHFIRLGYNLESGYRDNGIVWDLNSSYFGQWNHQNWFRYALNGDGVYSDKEIDNAYYRLSYEHFYRVNDFRTWYVKGSYRISENPYVDRPISLGGETGLRGYPIEYQHGNKQWLVNFEKRVYPNINFAQLLDLAFVGFIDFGRTFGETLYINQETKALASVGFGLRFFLTRSSGRNVISVNFSKPINSDFVNDFDISVLVRTSF